MKDIHTILKQTYGYDCFREGQEKLIRAILNGQDVMAILPTGAGKSLCYQIPALAMDGITLVVSPLISLMQDQVRALLSVGVRAAYLNSSLTPGQIALATRNAERGMYKIIYAAPERLLTESFLRFARSADISLLAVDEAHCISQWGQDFRPAYLKIRSFIDQLPHRPPVAAFTATATRQVSRDIEDQLGLQSPLCYAGGMDRPNLYFGTVRPIDKDAFICRYVYTHKDESGIIYCLTRKETERIADMLTSHGIGACAYHGGMADEDRHRVQDDFVYDRVRVIIATNAFGMGIDKPDVRFVLHAGMPSRMEDYYQQAGRAGRDGARAECILLFNPQELEINYYMIEQTPENDPLTPEQRKVYVETQKQYLQQMIYYAASRQTCLRKRILDYFGEKSKSSCGNCSICCQNIPVPTKNQIAAAYDERLFSLLKAQCKKWALFEGVPSYTIASDTMLRELSALKPQTTAQLRQISGFGEAKIRRYGNDLLRLIQQYK